MDPVTQGVLGASLPESLTQPSRIKHAALLGCLSGMAPDLDILIQSPNDPLLFLEYHRQFTHALLFIPFGALICAVVLYPLVRSRLTFLLTFAFCLLGYATHGLLDACTTYGTQLFWPLSDNRVAWNNVSVVDPLVTVPMLILVSTSIVRRSPRFAQAALVWLLCYLALGVVQKERAETAGWQLAQERNHVPVRLQAKPGFGTLLLWKIVYETDSHFHVDAIRTGISVDAFEGQALMKLDVAQQFPWLSADSQQARDIARFSWFSNDYLARDPHDDLQIIDVRYSIVPNEIDALWLIRLNPDADNDEHVQFVTRRSAPIKRMRTLSGMLLGT